MTDDDSSCPSIEDAYSFVAPSYDWDGPALLGDQWAVAEFRRPYCHGPRLIKFHYEGTGSRRVN